MTADDSHESSQVTRFGETAQGANIAAKGIAGCHPLSSVDQHSLFGPHAELVLAGQSERPSL